MTKQKLTDVEAKKIIASAHKAMDSALVAAGEFQREAKRKSKQDFTAGLTADDWKRLGLPGKGKDANTARLEARLKRAAKRLQMDPLVARFQRLGRELNKI